MNTKLRIQTIMATYHDLLNDETTGVGVVIESMLGKIPDDDCDFQHLVELATYIRPYCSNRDIKTYMVQTVLKEYFNNDDIPEYDRDKKGCLAELYKAIPEL